MKSDNNFGKILGLIPARGGSKGLPRKNVLPVAGKPLIAWTIDAAKQSRHLDRLVLSSDDEEIMATARRFGCDVPFRRPNSLADDAATTIDVAKHALQALPGYDILVVLQPTSPLRSSNDIDAAVERLITTQADSCVTVNEPDKSPYWSYSVSNNGLIEPLIDAQLALKRRQELPPAYVINGAVYAAKTAWLMRQNGFVGSNTVASVMPAGRSLDVDTLQDLRVSEILLSERQPLRQVAGV